MKGAFRLVYYPREMFADEHPEGFGELYNLELDPWEMNNLYFDKEHSGIARAMEHELLDRIIMTTRPVTATWGPDANTYTDEYLEADGKLSYSRFRNLRTKHYM